MTLEQINESIETDHRAWGEQYHAELDRVAESPAIAQRIVHFIEEAARHPKSTTGLPAVAVKHALKLSSLANFRMGVLVGLLLDRPAEKPTHESINLMNDANPVASVELCPQCLGTGAVCLHCGLPFPDCDCVDSTGLRLFSQVQCLTCDGEGKVE